MNDSNTIQLTTQDHITNFVYGKQMTSNYVDK